LLGHLGTGQPALDHECTKTAAGGGTKRSRYYSSRLELEVKKRGKLI